MSKSLFDELGVRSIVNACGTVTTLGGSVIHDETLEAMREASHVFLDMAELHKRAGDYIARLTGAEAAYVTAGTAASLVLSVAACMTGGETDKMLRLPNSDGMRNEVIVQRLHRNEFTHVLTFAGAKLAEIGDEHSTGPEDLERAINERTAAVVYFAYDPQDGVLSLEQVLQICHDRGIPVMVDAAAEIPPIENLEKFTVMGADLVLYSAGKDIGAPNDTGIILGRNDLVRTCMRLGPHSREIIESEPRNYIGRPMKISKEDILAVVAALKRYVRTDHDARLEEWKRKAEYIVSQISKHETVKAKIVQPGLGHPRPICVPRVELEFSDSDLRAEDIANLLKEGEPPIYAYVMNGKLYFNPQCLRNGEEEIVARRLSDTLEVE